MKPAAFDYVAAHSLEEALAALQEGGEDAKPIAGGQSLVPALNMRLVRPTLLVDLNRAGLDAIEANGVVRIGATVRQAALEHDPRTHPLLREALPHVGHFVTRNRGTVGGSVAHADGAAEIPLCLAALGGTVVVEGPSGRQGDRARRLLRHPLPDDARAGRARRRDDLAACRRRTRASRSRSSRCGPGTTGSRWWRSRSGASTAWPATCGCGSAR